MPIQNPVAFIGEAVLGSVAGAPLSTDQNGQLVSGTQATAVSDASNATTSSGTDVLLTSMTITPNAGTYIILFNCSVTSPTAGAAISFSIYVDTTQDAGSLVKIIPFSGGTLTSGNARGNAACIGSAVVNGSQAINIKWSTSAGTMTCGPRRLIILRIL